MGRFEKWGGWLAALVVGLAALGWMSTIQRDADSYREIAGVLKERIQAQSGKSNLSVRDLAQARTELAEAHQRIAALEGGPGGADGSGDVAGLFVGHWRLISYENFGEDGSVTKREMTGRIMYDGQGNMSAQLMPQGDAVEVENRRTQRYVAYFGTYEIDPEQGTVTHRPEGSTIFPWVGGELVRHYSFSDGNLELSLKNEERVTGTLTWERIE